MPRRARPLLLPVLLLALVGWTQAHVEGEPDRGLHWCESSIGVLRNSAGSADVADSGDLDALVDAMDAWNEIGCSHLILVDKGTTERTDSGHRASGGNTNLLLWLTGNEWSSRGENYVPSALALTTLWYAPSTGRVYDADIEFNDAHEWTAQTQNVKNDVMNTAMHEMGHMLGLDHVNDPQATMYTYSSSGELKKRDLVQDDIDGACAIYGRHYKDCKDIGCGCGAAGSSRGGAAWAAALVWLWLRSRRRRIGCS